MVAGEPWTKTSGNIAPKRCGIAETLKTPPAKRDMFVIAAAYARLAGFARRRRDRSASSNVDRAAKHKYARRDFRKARCPSHAVAAEQRRHSISWLRGTLGRSRVQNAVEHG